ncbi:DUF2218 domain-containing protein [Ancylobacter defluvii]|uniref:DUF2218 domain-containing protein n=1 Tax=Ancylobacter defluvii TaxID=1282440 RepID=A0A9W6JV25_9HYPH|nr:DUF2218 domain-containing protein [Ancylobacter defluvii]MBS7586040.1 DUF2218 domain-containing protein [Ancylobacter defluvii]GLK84420.1 hypothetical protein GCM10017653_24900 [Ancylobacter defluvii]
MSISSATVPTAHASRYLQQLCKHWAHKFEVSFTPEDGRIVLPENTVATLHADAAGLGVRLEAVDAETLERMKGVVARHLDRFAFREAPLPFDWRDAG